MLDSGAFSAWVRGSKLDLDDYIAYCLKNREYCDIIVNMDVIPGEFGRVPSADEVEASAQKSWDNLIYMEQFGLKPMPVFHQGERFYWLEKLIAHGCTYIGISPANDRTTAQKRLWLDDVFSAIVDDEGRATIQTHGFGVTSIDLLFRYPWHSADSTSWSLSAAYGNIYVPRRDELTGVWLPMRGFVVAMTPSKDSVSKSFESLSKMERQVVIDFLAEHGETVETARHSYYVRARINADFFLTMAAAHQNVRFRRVQKPFFQRA
jgi:hypothetical protein